MFRSSHNWGRGLEPRPTPWESGVFAGPPVWESRLLRKRYGCRGNPRGAEEAPLTFATSLISRPRSTFAGSSVDQGGERAVVSPEAFRGTAPPPPASGPEPGRVEPRLRRAPPADSVPFDTPTLRGMTAGAAQCRGGRHLVGGGPRTTAPPCDLGTESRPRRAPGITFTSLSENVSLSFFI